jgi:hypothetical protein
MSVVANYRSVGHSLHHSVEVERTGSLARWKFTEALQPLPNISRRRSQNEDVVDKPATVVDALLTTSLRTRLPSFFTRQALLGACPLRTEGQGLFNSRVTFIGLPGK